MSTIISLTFDLFFEKSYLCVLHRCLKENTAILEELITLRQKVCCFKVIPSHLPKIYIMELMLHNYDSQMRSVF